MIDPTVALLLAGILGGVTVMAYDIFSDDFTVRSLTHIIFGMVSAIIARLINEIPGTAGVFFTGLVAGIGGVTLIRQYVGNVEGHEAVVEASQEIDATIRQLEIYNAAFQQLPGIIRSDKSDDEKVQDIIGLLETTRE